MIKETPPRALRAAGVRVFITICSRLENKVSELSRPCVFLLDRISREKDARACYCYPILWLQNAS